MTTSMHHIFDAQQHYPSYDTVAPFQSILKKFYIGSAKALEQSQQFQAILSLGVVHETQVPTLHIDILDMDTEHIIFHFTQTTAFIQSHIDPPCFNQGSTKTQSNTKGKVLVHCVYGQSRSAAVCVAYLMQTKRIGWQEGYHMVRKARPCISINLGFLFQLQLFEHVLQGQHLSLYRTIQQKQTPKPAAINSDISGNSISCKKCRQVLCTSSNLLQYSYLTQHFLPAYHFNKNELIVEYLLWMQPMVQVGTISKLYCFKCRAKLGKWQGQR